MAKTGQPSTARVASTRRSLAILDVLADEPSLGTNEIARRLGTSASTTSRQLATLVEAGLVEHVPATGRYRLGIRLVRRQFGRWRFLGRRRVVRRRRCIGKLVMAGFKTLDDADHRRVTDAVAAAERTTDGEIVTIVGDLSDSYDDIRLLWAVGVASTLFLLLALIPATPTALAAWMSNGWRSAADADTALPILFGLVAAAFLAVYAMLSWMPLRLALTPRGTKIRRVRRRAIQYFKVGAEQRTAKRVGVLIYLSTAEHMAEIVADAAVAGRVPSEHWGDAMVAMIDLVRAGNPAEGIAAAVTSVGAILTEHFPKSEDDVNELPDRLIEL